MSFSYDPGGAREVDDIRADIGDTVESAPVAERLEDEEISRFLTRYGSTPVATAAAAKALIAKLSRRATEKDIGTMRLVYTQRIDSLWKLVGRLEAAAGGVAVPYLGGVSLSDRSSVESDTDRETPAFTRGMLDNPRAS